MPNLRKIFPPISLPVIFFGLMICLGGILLHSDYSHEGDLAWTDAFFTATSAVCVTGLTVVDTGAFFNTFGQTVILLLIQAGGLGIMTFASLAFFLWRRRVSLTDRIAVGQSILHDRTFHLGSFLLRMVFWTLLLETFGAITIFLLAPGGISPFSALFHAVSAFCNAGFSLFSDSLVSWRGAWGVNLAIMFLIIAGGLGFSVLVELHTTALRKLRASRAAAPGPVAGLSWYAVTIIKTSLLLILGGGIIIFLTEYIGAERTGAFSESVLAALFQSVTCRTAGFNTLDIANMTNISLLFMILLMFIGGATGSCAGGIKVSTFRVFWAFVVAQLTGGNQVVVRNFAIAPKDVSRALILIIITMVVIFFSTMILSVTEGGIVPHPEARGLFLDILFEVVSALGTVGLSTGLTMKLSLAGKWLITALMFIGRLGPLVFLAVIQELHRERLFRRPEESILIG